MRNAGKQIRQYFGYNWGKTNSDNPNPPDFGVSSVERWRIGIWKSGLFRKNIIAMRPGEVTILMCVSIKNP